MALERADRCCLHEAHVVMTIPHHVAQKGCLSQFDVREGRIPEEMG